MSKRVPLNRLRDLSKQRSIRRPLLIPVPVDDVEDCETVPTQVEWPVSR
jgi:hypothetical protein